MTRSSDSDFPIPKDELRSAAANLLGGEVAEFGLASLLYLITVTQCATDVLLNEIERRGELTFAPDPSGQWEFHLAPIVPYLSDYVVETILTRPTGIFGGARGAGRDQ